MDQLNPSEISELIKQRIAKADIAVSAKNEGTIVSVSDGIVRIYGLADVMYGEMVAVTEYSNLSTKALVVLSPPHPPLTPNIDGSIEPPIGA